MWVYNEDDSKWLEKDDSLSKSSFDVYKQELSATRFYAKCLSGATYLPVNDLDNIYDVLSYKVKRSWFIPISSSQYSETSIPENQSPIERTDSDFYYQKNLNDYSLTLKNKFTPDKLINDSVKNYYYTDVATTEQINITSSFVDVKIDGTRLLKGHKILVKDQVTIVDIPTTTDPDTYFTGNYTLISQIGLTSRYEYYNETNGVYEFDGTYLTKISMFDIYDDAFRYSIVVKLGSNVGKQFHLNRLLNGYYPNESEPKEFIEKKNWMIRNRVDYNNLFEINYYDSLKHGTQSINISGITYSIPERTISIGEFGVILNTQDEFGGISNVIRNKYKVNLFSISETTLYYWVCGEKGTLLRVRKNDFSIDKIDLPDILGSLNCVDFLSDSKGVVVGDVNTILVTENGGKNWEQVNISKFDPYDYNKVVYYSPTKFYVVGENGVFIEFIQSITGFKVYKKRLSKFIEKLEDEYLLVDDINDVLSATVSWGLTLSGSYSIINSEFIFSTTNDNNIILYDINDNFKDFNFIYLDFNNNYGDITNISKREGTDEFYFTSDKGVYSFNMNNFPEIDNTNGIYNIAYGLTGATQIDTRYYNDIFDYNGNQLILSGNESLLLSHTYSSTFNDVIDLGFSDRLKSKMLFMNYDIASKLNFFRDNGEYRLPETISFSASTSLEFNDPIISGTTQSNWSDYWRDSLQTFEYKTISGLDESTKVLLSVTFSNNINLNSGTVSGGITGTSSITNSLSDIINLAPEIGDDTSNRFYGTTSPSTPSVSKSIYLYKYLMVYKVILNYPVDKGDVLRIVSDNIETNLIVNKIFNDGLNKYLFMYTEFNDNIIRSIKESYCYIENLNKFQIVNLNTELVNKFNKHPLSIAYELKNIGNQSFELSSKFNNKTAYYNLATNIITDLGSYDSLYTDAFIDFGYSPIYNIYDYLNNIDPVKFYSDKEYLSMPVYKGIPLGSLTQSVAYIDNNNNNNNKILFGTDLKFEWESIFIDTFVDVNIYGSSASNTEKLLVMDKYYDQTKDAYVIEFHKKLNFTLLDTLSSVDIISRRKLIQISDDLRILNNIQRSKYGKTITIGSEYFVFDNELKSKIKTNSYTNVLLSDQTTKDNLTAVIYTDDINELSMNILNLEEELNPVVTGISEYNGKVAITFKDKHNLIGGSLILVSYSGESIVTVTNGCYPTSTAYDPNFFGSHVIQVLTPNVILLDVTWDPSFILNQIGISFIKNDAFFNYLPVDLIDIGVDKKGRTSIELLPENSLFKDNKYSLVNVDYNKFRFRLFDGLTINTLAVQYPWLLEAEVSNAAIGLVDGIITWYSGVWECGRWFEGNWISGTWLSGDFYGGDWTAKLVIDKKIKIEIADKKIIDSESVWHTGRWFGGNWNGGTWRTGRWYEGSFNNGLWYDGIWNDGDFNNGAWKGGIWVLGNWNGGKFNTDNKPSYWIDGKFNGGDFGNGVWYDGTFESKNGLARFGTESYNSRPSIWHGGDFLSGSFHSFLNVDRSGNTTRSKVNKYSIWYTGNFVKGDFYGGVAYNINFNGTWYGGILEDIQVIGTENIINDKNVVIGKKLKLNGVFRFNTSDKITIMNSDYELFETKVYFVEVVDKYTYIWTTPDVSISLIAPTQDTGYKLVSVFNNCTWKSGIWTNGVFNSGLWEGGVWYDGIFKGVSI